MPAVIFDLDGVLTDTNHLHVEAYRSVLNPLGIPYEAPAQFAGWTDEAFFTYVLARAGRGATAQDLIQKKTEILVNLINAQTVAMPGAAACVQSLAGQFPLAVATSSPPAVLEAALGQLGVLSLFRTRVTDQDVAKCKPDPEPFLRAAERLNMKPQDCVAIEDSRNGLLAAKRAGMRVIAVPDPRYTQNLNGADIIVPNLSHVTPELVLKLCNGHR